MSAVKKGRVPMDTKLLYRKLECIDLVAVGEDVEEILGGDEDRGRESLVDVKDRLISFTKGIRTAREGKRDLDADIKEILNEMDSMLGISGETYKKRRSRRSYDALRYRLLQSLLEEKAATLSVPTSKRARLKNVKSYLTKAEVFLSNLLPERIERKLEGHVARCPWAVDLEICEDYINAYSGLRIAWDMLYFMTYETSVDVVVLVLGPIDSEAWETGIIEKKKPPAKLWKSVLRQTSDYDEGEIHVYSSDNLLLTKLPPGRGSTFAFKPNQRRLTPAQMRSQIWTPWLLR